MGVWRGAVAASVFAVLGLLPPSRSTAQELEPRLLSNVPVGMNFALAGYVYSTGNVLLDPAVPIEDLDSRVHTIVGAYVRAFGLAGRSSKFDVVIPFASGDWKGRFEGQDSARAVSGLGDPRIRLSMAFAGAPALSAADFASLQQGTTAGASLQLILPLGQYDPSKLINLGSNRWVVRGQVGLSQTVGPWILEMYAGGWFFSRNADFFGGSTLEQKPLATAKTHIIRLFPRGRWLAVDVGYGIGGRTTIDGVERETRISTVRFGLTLAWPLGARHTVRFLVASSRRFERGPDFDAFGTSYQHRWGGTP